MDLMHLMNLRKDGCVCVLILYIPATLDRYQFQSRMLHGQQKVVIRFSRYIYI